MDKKKMSFGARFKEGLRKMIVTLKHKPHYIPMLMLAITFVYYSLNLTHVSNATAAINRTPMGLCGFITMLLSMLSLVCFMNAFPHRKPVNKPMLILMFLMFAIILASDVVYMMTIINAVTAKVNPFQVKPDNLDTLNFVLNDLWRHGILLLISIGLIILLPVYSKLIRKINTSIEVEAGKDMAAIDITEE